MSGSRSKLRRRAGNSTVGLWTLGAVVVGSMALGVALMIGTGRAGDGSPVDVQAAVVQGPSSVLGVTADVTEVDFGRVPLDRVVTQVFRIRNTSNKSVAVAQPSVETLEGCCPSIPVVGADTLAPSEETTVSMDMMMHRGMDGPHLFRLSVPLNAGDGWESLPLVIRANFG